ncbi:MAG: phytol kinase [Candidatus Methanomethylophilaceae archaeon]|nr:phytol kinase [Candidatus Methanomethylophilaceae archaeon]
MIGQVSAEGHSMGLFFYACTITVMVLFFFEHFVAASIGIIAMTYGDGLSSLIGKRYGKREIYHGKMVRLWKAVLPHSQPPS